MARQALGLSAPRGFVAAVLAATCSRQEAAASVFDGRQRTWRETLDRAARIAGGLLARGVRPGDRVAILSANSDDYLALFLAAPWAGAVLVPLNCRWSGPELRFALNDCTPALLFADADLLDAHGDLLDTGSGVTTGVVLGPVRPGWSGLDELLASGPAADAGRRGEDLFAIFYTGGTTGRSKGVMLSHAGFVANCIAMRDAGLFPDGCRALVVAPLFHIAAAAVLTMAMLAGGTAVIAPAFSPEGALHLVASESVTDALFVPTMIQMILDAPGFDPASLSGLRRVLYGASPMPEATLDRMMAAAPHVRFFQAYGMTELSCAATLLAPEYHEGDHRAQGRHRGAGLPIGIAEIAVVDEDGTAVPVGEVGEVVVRGAGVMHGYWGQPERTAEVLRGGWLWTGDGGRLDEHGILYVVDRIKDMIVSGGENVFSGEVESALATHPAVSQVAVIAVPDERWGERVHAVVLPRPGVQVSEAELLAHCRSRIAGFKCPRSYEFRSTPLPLSPAGKVLKTALRAPHWKGLTRNVA